MPMFEYVCRACGERFEELRSAKSEEPGPVCPECGSGDVVKLLSSFAAGPSGAGRGGSSAGSCGGPGRFT